MTGFFLAAAILLATGVGVLLWPLLRSAQGSQEKRASGIVALYRDQLRELEAERKSGTVEETQYQLVSHEDAYGSRMGTASEGYWAAQGDNSFVPGRSYYPAQGWQQGPPQPSVPQPVLPQPLRGLFSPLFGDSSESNGVRRDPDYFWGKRTN